jgi:hypothetical protein
MGQPVFARYDRPAFTVWCQEKTVDDKRIR